MPGSSAPMTRTSALSQAGSSSLRLSGTDGRIVCSPGLGFSAERRVSLAASDLVHRPLGRQNGVGGGPGRRTEAAMIGGRETCVEAIR